MVDLATDQTITQAAMTSIVDHLGELGYVERTRSEYDRRVVKVSVTRKGEEEVKIGIRLYKKFIEKVTADLTASETRSLLSILDHMLKAAQSDQRPRERS
jgi:DNA-binding MarR family transcriptional regulator